MIMIFFVFLGIKLSEFKKSQIKFIDDVIYLCDFLTLQLKSTMPDTKAIMIKLKNDERLGKYDFNNLSAYSALDNYSNERLRELNDIFGRYVLDTQLDYIEQIKSYFVMKKEEYTLYYRQHYKLYYTVSLAMGLLITILLY